MPKAGLAETGAGAFEVRFSSGAKTLCVIRPGALRELSALAAEAGLSGTAGILCDARLLSLPAGDAIRSLEPALGPAIARLVSESGKRLAEVDAMCDALAARGVARDGFVVAVGGGVLTDLAGLAAALYQRGVPWVSAPTTLLAQVDAGLGGKTGANLGAGKNLVGAFHQPRLVVCDPELLSTLPERERWSGLAEIVKCALVAPEADDLLARCEKELERAAAGDAAALAQLVGAAVRIKARIVAADEREGGARAFLNLGHTAGHALEAATGYDRFTHGEAVALGLRGALELSRSHAGLSAAEHARALGLVRRVRLSVDATLSAEARAAALLAMSRDKKARGGQVRFVLLERLGAPKLVEVDAAACAAALDASCRV